MEVCPNRQYFVDYLQKLNFKLVAESLKLYSKYNDSSMFAP